MTLSLIRGKYVVCKVTGPNAAEVVDDGAVLQRDGVIEAVGTTASSAASIPTPRSSVPATTSSCPGWSTTISTWG